MSARPFAVAGTALALTGCFPEYVFVDGSSDGGSGPPFCASVTGADVCEDFDDGLTEGWVREDSCSGALLVQKDVGKSGPFGLEARMPTYSSTVSCTNALVRKYAQPWRRARLELDIWVADVTGIPEDLFGPSIAGVNFGPGPDSVCNAELFLSGTGRNFHLNFKEHDKDRIAFNPSIVPETWYRVDLEIIPGANDSGRMVIGFQREGEARVSESYISSCTSPPPSPVMTFTVGTRRHVQGGDSPPVTIRYDNVVIRFP